MTDRPSTAGWRARASAGLPWAATLAVGGIELLESPWSGGGARLVQAGGVAAALALLGLQRKALFPAAAATASAMVVVAILAGAVGGGPVYALLVVTAVATARVVRTARRGTAAAAMVVTAVAVTWSVTALLLGSDGGFLGALLTVPVVVAAGFGNALRGVDRERRLALDAVRLEERLELARELHDVVAHHLTAIVVRAQSGGVLAEHGADTATLRPVLGDIERTAHEAMVSMRTMVRALRDGENAGTMDPLADIRSLLEASARAGVDVHADVRVDAVPGSLGPTVVALTREALTNVRKHSGAGGSARLVVCRSGRFIEWSVYSSSSRDGSASSAPRSLAGGPGGYGLVGLRERVESLGGRLEAGPVHDGWLVRAQLPADFGSDSRVSG